MGTNDQGVETSSPIPWGESDLLTFFTLEREVLVTFVAASDRVGRDMDSWKRWLDRGELILAIIIFIIVISTVALFTASVLTEEILAIPRLADLSPHFLSWLVVLATLLFVGVLLPVPLFVLYLILLVAGLDSHRNRWRITFFIGIPTTALIVTGIASGLTSLSDWLSLCGAFGVLILLSLFIACFVTCVLWISTTLLSALGRGFKLLRLPHHLLPFGQVPSQEPELNYFDIRSLIEEVKVNRFVLSERGDNVSKKHHGDRIDSQALLSMMVVTELMPRVASWPVSVWPRMARLAERRMQNLAIRNDAASYLLAALALISLVQLFFPATAITSFLERLSVDLSDAGVTGITVPLITFLLLVTFVIILFVAYSYFARAQETAWTLEIIQWLAHLNTQGIDITDVPVLPTTSPMQQPLVHRQAGMLKVLAASGIVMTVFTYLLGRSHRKE